MDKRRKTGEAPKKKIIRTEYVSLKIHTSQIVYDYVTGNDVPKYGGIDFNKSYIYNAKGFCSYQESNKIYDKLDFKRFYQVLNFLNKEWGWKVLSVAPIVTSSASSSGYKAETEYLLYTFYREIEEDEDE